MMPINQDNGNWNLPTISFIPGFIENAIKNWIIPSKSPKIRHSLARKKTSSSNTIAAIHRWENTSPYF